MRDKHFFSCVSMHHIAYSFTACGPYQRLPRSLSHGPDREIRSRTICDWSFRLTADAGRSDCPVWYGRLTAGTVAAPLSVRISDNLTSATCDWCPEPPQGDGHMLQELPRTWACSHRHTYRLVQNLPRQSAIWAGIRGSSKLTGMGFWSGYRVCSLAGCGA